jgi:putative sterol carrier protein
LRDLGAVVGAGYACASILLLGETHMDLTTVTEHIRGAVGDNSGLGKTVKLDLGDVGKIFIDGTSSPNTVTNEDKPADATVSMKWDDFIALSEGKLDPMMAFMQGKLKIAGDMMIAQKLAPLLKR